MKLIRPVRATDLEALLALARAAGVGLTTLPPDEAVLSARVADSEHAMARPVRKPAGECYLFVMEDMLTGAVEGTAGIVARVGGFDPFYAYRVERRALRSERLDVDKSIRRLHLVREHSGPSEVGTLFIHHSARGGGHGRLLSLSRFLFMAAHPGRFDPEVIAEMRGVLDEDDGSPFWEAVGRHFFDVDFARADAASAADKGFIAELMPHHPIYIPLLPPEVQEIIGQVHRDTEPAKALLDKEGFVHGDQVDIFDAGPLLKCRLTEVRTVKASKVAPLGEVFIGEGTDHLVSNERLKDFRCALGLVRELEDGRVALPKALALALELRIGDPVRYVSAR